MSVTDIGNVTYYDEHNRGHRVHLTLDKNEVQMNSIKGTRNFTLCLYDANAQPLHPRCTLESMPDGKGIRVILHSTDVRNVFATFRATQEQACLIENHCGVIKTSGNSEGTSMGVDQKQRDSGAEKKIEILTRSFNVLRETIYENSNDLGTIFQKVSLLDLDLAIEMWIDVLKNYQHINRHCNETYYLTNSTVFHLCRTAGDAKIADLVYNNDFLRKKLLQESAMPDDDVIAYYINTGNLVRADECLRLVNSNPHHAYSSSSDESDRFGYYLYYLISLRCKILTQEASEFLLTWCERVRTAEYRAKIELLLVDYM